jgi:sRNA-binding carbon storage regulator CsrA
MGYLVLTRKEGEKITLRVQPGTNAEELLEQLLLDGITIRVGQIGGGQVKNWHRSANGPTNIAGELEEA